MWRSYLFHLLFLIAVGLIANIVIVALLFPDGERIHKQRVSADLHSTFTLVNEALRHNSPAQMQALLHEIGRHSSLPIALLPSDAGELDTAGLETLNSDVTWIAALSPLTAYRQSEDGNYLIKIGPAVYSDDVKFLDAIGDLTIVFMVLVASLLWSAWQHYKISLLQRCMMDYSQGLLTVRAPLSVRSVGQLSQNFNDMASRIQNLIDQQRYMTNALAHELRTPLSRVRFYTEQIAYQGANDQQQMDIEKIDRNIGEVDQLINDMIRYSRLQQAHIELNANDIDINTWLQPLASEFAQHSRTEVSLRIGDDHPICLCDTDLLARVFWNLSGNAERYAKSRIDIEMRMLEHCIELRIANDGESIAPGERENIFKPFVRLDKSRTRLSGGHGLGLAIVREIVKLHGGTVCIEDITTPFTGIAFVIRLPKTISHCK